MSDETKPTDLTASEAVSMLRCSVSEWNMYRAAGGIVPDLRRADLRRADLSRANLRRADLSRADLSGAYLSRANLSRANLSRADLSGADLRGAYLNEANLNEANLRRANLSRADLSGADLSGADLSRTIGCVRLDMVDPREYQPIAVAHKDGCWMIKSGCQWFTVTEALEHWGSGYVGDRSIGDRYLRAIAALPPCPEVSA